MPEQPHDITACTHIHEELETYEWAPSDVRRGPLSFYGDPVGFDEPDADEAHDIHH